MEKNERCDMCGTADWEWDEDQGGSRFAYEAVEKQCQGCLRSQTLRDQEGQKPGVTVILIKTGTVEYAKRQKRSKLAWQNEMNRKAESDRSRQLQRERNFVSGRSPVPVGDVPSAGLH